MPSQRLSVKQIDKDLSEETAMPAETSGMENEKNEGEYRTYESEMNPKMLSAAQVRKFSDSADGRKLVAWVKRQYNSMRQVRRVYERQWYTNLSFYMGKQYVDWSRTEDRLIPLPKLDKYTPRITVNKIRPHRSHRNCEAHIW